MAGFYPIPDTITAQTLTEVPSHLWSTKTTEWLPGECSWSCESGTSPTIGSGNPPLIFLEGPTTDTQGNLFVVDVAYGRILRYDLNGRGGDKGDGAKDAGWTVLADYDGEPNGLALDLDGTLIVADYKNGIVSVPAALTRNHLPPRGLRADDVSPPDWRIGIPLTTQKHGAVQGAERPDCSEQRRPV